MATQNGQSAADLDQEQSAPPPPEGRSASTANLALARMLRDKPWQFRFFQMVRLLERLHPERKPVGIFVAPADEVARFSAHTTLAFPASEIQSFTEGEGGPDRLQVNFMGLSTINGPLPAPYTELLLERARQKDHTASEFFDIFNHRIVSLFYRAWKKYRFYIGYEQARGQDDLVTRLMYDLLGLGTEGLRNRMPVADDVAISYGGLLGQNLRTAQGLQQILADYFQVQVVVEQFTGTWNRLPTHDQTYLRYGTTDSERLGCATVLGDEAWDQQGTLTVRIGPMPMMRYTQFLPGGTAHTQLTAWLRFYGRAEFDFVVKLVLERNEVPPVLLTGETGKMARLGFASWIKNKSFTRDPDEATYRLH